MQKFKIISLITCLLFIITGCFQSNTIIKVTPKGDGTIEETFLMKAEVIKQLRDMMSGMQQASKTNSKEAELWSSKQFNDKALAMGTGVSVVSFKPIKNDEVEGYNVIYKFTDINNLHINQNPSENMPNQKSDKNKAENLTFHFTKGVPAELTIISPMQENAKNTQQKANKTEATNSEQADAMVQQMQSIFKDLNISLKLEVQGKIIKTDATYVTNSTITLMEMDFNKLLANPEKLKELNKQNPQSLEETKKVMSDIPGIKVNLNPKTKVLYQ